MLHLLYASICGCVVDLKPQNILLDENDNPILCDFGLYAYSGTDLQGAFTGTSLYNDCSRYASHGRDIFAYGVIIFQLLTDGIHEMSHGSMLASKISEYVNEDKDLGTLIKPHLQIEAHVVTKLLHIGVKCLNEEEILRPSALEILEEFEDIW